MHSIYIMIPKEHFLKLEHRNNYGSSTLVSVEYSLMLTTCTIQAYICALFILDHKQF